MAKRKKNDVLPKRVLGMRVPKGARRFAASPVGAALIADVVILGAATVLRRPALKGAMRGMGAEAAHAGSAGASMLAHVAQALLLPVTAAAHSIMDRADRRRVAENGHFDGHGERDDLRRPAEQGPDASAANREDAAGASADHASVMVG